MFSLLQRRELPSPLNKAFESFPSVSFAPGAVIAAKERSAVYALQDVGTVRVVAKMAAGMILEKKNPFFFTFWISGDLTLHVLLPGSVFVTDPTFFGLPDDAKVFYAADENASVLLREVSVEALGEAESEALCVTVLKELFKYQMLEAQVYAQIMNTSTK